MSKLNFLVQMRQCNKCEIVRNDDIFNLTYTWDLVQALESVSPISCKTPATFIDSICSNIQAGKSKESRNEIQLPTDLTVLYTQNPGLREVDLKPSPKRGSDKNNMLKQRRKVPPPKKTKTKTSRIV